MNRIYSSILGAIATAILLPAAAFAHVVVTPTQAGVGARTLFTVSVPNEKEVAVSRIVLDIPSELQDVQPNVMAGWTITTAKDAHDNVTSITWTGTIPVGQRADLIFKAQTPASAGELDWKAYQTYADDSVVPWDQKPTSGSSKDTDSDAGPYSVTHIVNDLTSTDSNSQVNNWDKSTLALIFAGAALLLSAVGLFLRRK